METKWNIKKTAERGMQYAVKAGMYALPWRVPKVMSGSGKVKCLPGVVKKCGLKKVLVVTGPKLMRLHRLDGMLKAMEEAGLEYVVYDKTAVNPTEENVEEGVRLYQDTGCGCMIAFGGGSPMDCAKAIGARIARPKKSVGQLQGLFKVLRPLPVIFAVPTTAGTGSETTIAAVITDTAAHHKASINDLCMMPRFAVLDPELTAGLPPEMTAAAGMDALCHAVEAYTNHIYNTALEDGLCCKAVKLIYDNLYRVCRDDSDIEARGNMQRAAFYAGRAFSRGSVGYVHAVGHTLGGLYGTGHSLAMAILLPHVMRAYGPAVYERLARLCDVCGICSVDETDESKAEAFLCWIEETKEKAGLPKYPDMIKEEDVDQIAEWADKEANPLYPVPVIWSRKELRKFIRSIMK